MKIYKESLEWRTRNTHYIQGRVNLLRLGLPLFYFSWTDLSFDSKLYTYAYIKIFCPAPGWVVLRVMEPSENCVMNKIVFIYLISLDAFSWICVYTFTNFLGQSDIRVHAMLLMLTAGLSWYLWLRAPPADHVSCHVTAKQQFPVGHRIICGLDCGQTTGSGTNQCSRVELLLAGGGEALSTNTERGRDLLLLCTYFKWDFRSTTGILVLDLLVG